MILDMMLEGVVGTLNERGKRLVGLAQQSVSSLISMLNDLLDVERYESGGLILNYEESDVDSLINNAVGMVKPEADSKKIALVSTYDIQKLEVDVGRINRVLVNLISNAVKFSPEHSTISITSEESTGEEDDIDMIQFKIIDEGPGIPKEKLHLVFEKFKQVGIGGEGEKKGSGLGLAICKAIVEAHGGKIGVDSKVGEGSVFWFKIPLHQTDESQAA